MVYDPVIAFQRMKLIAEWLCQGFMLVRVDLYDYQGQVLFRANEQFIIDSKPLHRSHIPLHKWLYAMYLIVTARKGISSLQLSKELGISQKSAWFLEHRIRAACGNMTNKILSGIVEVDEAYIGGKESNKHESKKLHQGRGTVGKMPVFGIRERDGNVVAQVVDSTDASTLQDIIKQNVSVGSTVCTDEHKSYGGLNGGFVHKTVNHSAKQYVNGMAHTNGIESFWAVLKRGFYGTYTLSVLNLRHSNFLEVFF